MQRPLAENRVNVFAYIGPKDKGRNAIRDKKESFNEDSDMFDSDSDHRVTNLTDALKPGQIGRAHV